MIIWIQGEGNRKTAIAAQVVRILPQAVLLDTDEMKKWLVDDEYLIYSVYMVASLVGRAGGTAVVASVELPQSKPDLLVSLGRRGGSWSTLIPDLTLDDQKSEQACVRAILVSIPGKD